MQTKDTPFQILWMMKIISHRYSAKDIGQYSKSEEMTKIMTDLLFFKVGNVMFTVNSQSKVMLQISIDTGSKILILNLLLLK